MPELCQVREGDCVSLINDGIRDIAKYGVTPVIVTDPPFNIGYKYRTYNDNKPEQDYLAWVADITKSAPAVIILYPEMLHKLTLTKGYAPEKVISWVYNSNTAKQHRDIAFYQVKPDMTKVKQAYKNPNDKRVAKLIAEGKGARLYDWWEINQVKNVNRDKTLHPCQMPLEVMDRIIGILPDGVGVIDPFCGSGTTGVACKQRNVPFIGYEIDPVYCEIAQRRIKDAGKQIGVRMNTRRTP